MIVVNQASRADVAQIVKLRIEHSAEAYGHTPEAFCPPNRQHIAEFDMAAATAHALAYDTETFFVARQESAIVGYLSVSEQGCIGFAMPKAVFVSGIYIAQTHRTGHVLRALIRRAHAWAVLRDIEAVHCTVLFNNTRVVDMLRRLGFTVLALVFQKRGLPDVRSKQVTEKSDESGRGSSLDHRPGRKCLSVRPHEHGRARASDTDTRESWDADT